MRELACQAEEAINDGVEKVDMLAVCDCARLAAMDEGEKRGRLPGRTSPLEEDEEGVENAEDSLAPLMPFCILEEKERLGRAGVEGNSALSLLPDRGDTLVNGDSEEERRKGEEEGSESMRPKIGLVSLI